MAVHVQTAHVLLDVGIDPTFFDDEPVKRLVERAPGAGVARFCNIQKFREVNAVARERSYDGMPITRDASLRGGRVGCCSVVEPAETSKRPGGTRR